VAQEKRQRQRDNREKRLAAERKAARTKALRRRIIQVVILFVIVVAVLGINSLLGGDDGEETTETTVATTETTVSTTETTVAATVPETTPTTAASDASGPVAIPAGYDDYRTLPVACGGTLPDPVEPMQFDAPEDQGLSPDDQVVATVVTSCGEIVLELDPAAAPETVNSFVFLARAGYFDGQAFHRLVEGFMAQGGDPSAVGGGGPGYTIPDEFPADGFTYEKGILAMANRGPGTSGSQFFIMFGERGLPPQYSVFGRTVGSDATMDAIEAIPKELRGTELSIPMEGLFIERVDIEVNP
jgi:cyclophilin family peptidyl-prolyl cis-trans isomerase